MTIVEALVNLRDDIRLWCINNFNTKVPNERKINGKSLSSDINLTVSDIGADEAGAAAQALAEAKRYCDEIMRNHMLDS